MKASDGTGTQVDVQMINRCKAEMREWKLYNVMKSLREGDEKTLYEEQRNRNIREKFILVFCFFCKQCYPCIKPNKFTEAKFFDPSSTNIYCGLRFGPGPDQQNLGQENRATTTIIQMYFLYHNFHYDISKINGILLLIVKNNNKKIISLHYTDKIDLYYKQNECL